LPSAFATPSPTRLRVSPNSGPSVPGAFLAAVSSTRLVGAIRFVLGKPAPARSKNPELPNVSSMESSGEQAARSSAARMETKRKRSRDRMFMGTSWIRAVRRERADRRCTFAEPGKEYAAPAR
jgi:hypothetical protein